MVIIFGRRSYGRVDAHGGEHAQTTFAHVYYMPIVPVSSFWVTQDLGATVRGYSIRTSGKSIAAAYLRCWGPIAALAVLATGSVGGYFAAAGLAAASAWAWSWRSLRGTLAHRRSDFQLLAFGTRCDPERMPSDMREKLKQALDARWAALDVARSPDDVADHGASSTREAVIAYGLLRLASIDAPREARIRAGAAAKRILDGTREALSVGDGPYRGGEHEDATSPPIFDDVASAASATSAAAAASVTAAKAAQRSMRTPWWRPTRGVKVIGSLLLAMACLGGIFEKGPSLFGARELAATAIVPSGNDYVALRCGPDIENVGEFADHTQVYACVVDTTVVLAVGDLPSGKVLVGKLHSLATSTKYKWSEDILTAPGLSSSYLELDSLSSARSAAIACMVGLLVIAAAWTRVWWRKRSSQR